MKSLPLVAGYLGAIVAANLSVAHWGPTAAIYNAFLFIGLDLTCRDRLHDLWHGHLLRNMAVLIATGSVISYLAGLWLGTGPFVGRIALASCAAFAAAATADSIVYHLLRDRGWYERVNQSNLAGAAVDSLVFVALWPFGFNFTLAFTLFAAKVAGGVVWSFVLKQSAGADWLRRNTLLWGAAVMLLVHSSPTTLEAHRRPNLGVLSSPRRFYTNVDGWAWAADNDAYSQWDPMRYRTMLDAIAGLPGCVFVTAPDVVADWYQTARAFDAWEEIVADSGLPVAYVIQDGQPLDEMPWGAISAVFIGGTDEWKMGEPAAEIVAEAKTRRLWVHMGRVNGNRRLMYAKAIGCDSVDGTKLSWFRDTYLDDFLARAAAPTQLLMETT